jgi:hypothetical protein
MHKAIVVTVLALALAGCGGGQEGGAKGTGGLDTACLKDAGFEHDPNLATVALDGADVELVDPDGVTIYRAESAEAAAEIARDAQASDAEGSVGEYVYLSSEEDEAEVRACL